MTLHIFWQLDAALLSVPWPGYYVVNFQLTAKPYPEGLPPYPSYDYGLFGLLNTLPGAFLLSWAHWDMASHFVTEEEAPWFLFEPQVYLANIPGDTQQFAYSEEPHHVLIS